MRVSPLFRAGKEAGMAQETLWNGVVLSQPDSLFPLGTDSVALSSFARFPHGARVADLGCGGGAIALML